MNKKPSFGCSSCVKEPVERINATRFIEKLDSFFAKNDLAGAGTYLDHWEGEARSLGDDRGLLTVLNEKLGFYRRTNEREKAMTTVGKVQELIRLLDLDNALSTATIYVNAATTLKAFGRPEEGLGLYDKAEKIYLANNQEDTFEYTAFLNNKATALCDQERYQEAESCYRRAIEILKAEGKHDGEIAVTLINLAHLIFDRDSTAYEQVEETLDLAWEYLNSPRQPRDANYAFILSKCAPSLRYFKRTMEANALEAVAREIYGGTDFK